MTFDQIVAEVADRLNLTSTQAITRIGRSVNLRYKWLSSTLGLQTLARTVVTANTVIGNQSVTFTNVVKTYSIFNPAFTPPQILEEVTIDELRNQPIHADPPSQFAIQLTGATSLTVKLNSVPASIYALGADAEAIVATLSGSQVPAFTENFHDILIYGAAATELDKMEKYDKSNKHEALFQVRLAELRYHIAKSAYMQMYQGRTSGTNRLVQLV